MHVSVTGVTVIEQHQRSEVTGSNDDLCEPRMVVTRNRHGNRTCVLKNAGLGVDQLRGNKYASLALDSSDIDLQQALGNDSLVITGPIRARAMNNATFKEGRWPGRFIGGLKGEVEGSKGLNQVGLGIWGLRTLSLDQFLVYRLGQARPIQSLGCSKPNKATSKATRPQPIGASTLMSIDTSPHLCHKLTRSGLGDNFFHIPTNNQTDVVPYSPRPLKPSEIGEGDDMGLDGSTRAIKGWCEFHSNLPGQEKTFTRN